MKKAPWPLRLPIIRHVRYIYHRWQVNRHYHYWAKFGMLPNLKDRDEKILRAIFKGEL